jgi:hypothetical protein
MDFQLLGDVTDIEVIARGPGVRNRALLNRRYGTGKWRKLKGTARVRLINGEVRLAEVHWYEAHGIGRRELKLKLPFLD